MDISNYADILKFVFKTQIECIKEEEEKETFETEYQGGYYAGMVRGLQIALGKIDASKFLWENK